MFNPNKSDEDKKPGLAVAISFGKPKSKGFNPNKGESEDDEEPTRDGDPDQLMDQACEGICDALNVSSKAAPRLREYLEAFVHAADSKPHSEGEHENEGEENES